MKGIYLIGIGILLILLGIINAIACGIQAYEEYEEREETKLVDCYDENDNKIIGLQCELKPTWQETIGFGVFFLIIMSMIGTIFIVSGKNDLD